MIPSKIEYNLNHLCSLARADKLCVIEAKHADGTPAYVIAGVMHSDGNEPTDTCLVKIFGEFVADPHAEYIMPEGAERVDHDGKPLGTH